MDISQINSKLPYTQSPKTTIEPIETQNDFGKDIKQTKDAPIANKDISHIWGELSKQYDITNATFNELSTISTTLYEAGAISLKEHAGLTFDFERATESLKQEIPGISSNFTMYATEANESGKRNWIEEFQKRENRSYNHGSIIGHESNLNLASILQKLQR